ncbi:MAG: MFS transporter [Culturomica sp.]|jgi:FSR family fosmidomycin resistance protein-like MFS transporter|nr:MFS transporter [Culturomica sp.]
MYSKKHSYMLTLGHLCTDLNQGAISAMLPFVIAHYGFSYARASMLVLGCSIVSSVVQPLFGWMGDRFQRPWLMSLGIFLAGFGIFMMGLFSTFLPLFCCTMLTGVGIALFHPEGGRLANVVAGANKGTGIGNFAVGGNLGFAVGPLLVALTFPYLGMRGALIFIIPALIASVLLLTQNRKFTELSVLEEKRKKKAGELGLKDNWREFWKVTTVNIMRSVISRSHLVFIPLFWVAIFNQSDANGAMMITIFTFVGAFATFLGGRIADRIGFKNEIIICGVLMTLSIFGFLFAQNIILAGILVILTSVFINLAYSPIVALSQGYLPNHIGLASGISLGVVVSMGAVAAPFLGMVGDAHGLLTVFVIICIVSFVSLVFSLFLKNDKAVSSSSGR